jgi:hypothetical protein
MRDIWCEVAIYSKIRLGRGFKSKAMWLSQFLWSPIHPTDSSNPSFSGASPAPCSNGNTTLMGSDSIDLLNRVGGGEQERQCTNNLTLRRVCLTILP